ncbi:MAG: leucine-rich repeat domain-containing protein [Promethearchaeota archaeon]
MSTSARNRAPIQLKISFFLILSNFTSLSGCVISSQFTNLHALDLRWNLITEIKGLEILTNLQKLDLGGNQITEISGLNNLTNLRHLDLSMNHIRKIKGLEKLKELKKLDLSRNPIRPNERYLEFESAQDVVKYCQEKAKSPHFKEHIN